MIGPSLANTRLWVAVGVLRGAGIASVDWGKQDTQRGFSGAHGSPSEWSKDISRLDHAANRLWRSHPGSNPLEVLGHCGR